MLIGWWLFARKFVDIEQRLLDFIENVKEGRHFETQCIAAHIMCTLNDGLQWVLNELIYTADNVSVPQSHIHQPTYTQRVIMIMIDSHTFTSLHTGTEKQN